MMFADNQRISMRQVQALLLLNLFSTAILFLPAELAESAGHSAWILLAVAGVLISLLLTVLAHLGRQNPEFSVVEWSRYALGNFFGTMVSVAVGLKLIFDAAMELRIFSEILCRTMYFEAPTWVPMLALTSICTAAAIQGVEARGRSAEICFFLVFLPLIGFLAAVSCSTDFWRVWPVVLPETAQIKSSLPVLLVPLQGVTFLWIIFPNLKRPQRAVKGIFYTCMAANMLYVLLVFLCLAIYGAEMLAVKVYPVLQLLGRVSFSGILLSRQDVLLLWFWVVCAFTFVSCMLFSSTVVCVKVMRQQAGKKRKFWVIGCAVLMYALAAFPVDLPSAYRLRLYISPWTNGIILFIMPIIFLLIDYVKRRLKV